MGAIVVTIDDGNIVVSESIPSDVSVVNEIIVKSNDKQMPSVPAKPKQETKSEPKQEVKSPEKE